MTTKQQLALQMIMEWASESYKSEKAPEGAFSKGVNCAKWEVQQLLKLAGL
jgi:hypothetical protein